MKITEQDVRDIITEAEVSGDVDELVNDETLDDQGIDSLDAANVYLLLEEKYGIKIPDEDLKELQTINGIVKYMNEKSA